MSINRHLQEAASKGEGVSPTGHAACLRETDRARDGIEIIVAGDVRLLIYM
jgi:hypothetical protein